MTDGKQRQRNPELDMGDIGKLVCNCRSIEIRELYFPHAEQNCPFFENCPNFEPAKLTRVQFIQKYYPNEYNTMIWETKKGFSNLRF